MDSDIYIHSACVLNCTYICTHLQARTDVRTFHTHTHTRARCVSRHWRRSGGQKSSADLSSLSLDRLAFYCVLTAGFVWPPLLFSATNDTVSLATTLRAAILSERGGTHESSKTDTLERSFLLWRFREAIVSDRSEYRVTGTSGAR